MIKKKQPNNKQTKKQGRLGLSDDVKRLSLLADDVR